MADYNIPVENRYSKHDEWVRQDEDGCFVIGVTDYAQQQLGDVVFVEVPEPGSRFEVEDSFGVIESVKAVSDLFAPIAGEIVRVNETLEDVPESVNEDCYGAAWIIVIRSTNENPLADLMDATAYQQYIAERED